MTASNTQSPVASPVSHLPQLPSSAAQFTGRSPGWPSTAQWGGATGTNINKRNTSGTSSSASEMASREGWGQHPRSTSANWREESAVRKDSLYGGTRQVASAKATQFSPHALAIQPEPSQPRRSSQPVSRGNSAMAPARSASGTTLATTTGPQSMSGSELVNSFRAMTVQDVQSLPPIEYPTLSPQPTHGVTPRTSYSEFPPQVMGHYSTPQQYVGHHQYPTPNPSLYGSPGLPSVMTSPQPPYSPVVSSQLPSTILFHTAGPTHFPVPYHFAPPTPTSPVASYHPQAPYTMLPSPIVHQMSPTRGQFVGPPPTMMGMPSMHAAFTQQSRAPQLLFVQRPTTSLPTPYASPITPNFTHSPLASTFPHRGADQKLRDGAANRLPPNMAGPHSRAHLPSRTQVPADGTMRSQLLEEFRNNKSRKWELRDIFGAIDEFSGDQHGSRFIQQKLETAEADELDRVFIEIVPDHALPLMSDVFGNYVIQKLLEFGTQAHRDHLVKVMRGHILELSLNMYGCRVVQRAIEYIAPDVQSDLIEELEADIMNCVNNSHGNHVIQKLLQCVAPERLNFVRNFHGLVLELGQHPYGCRVLQRCFEHLPDEYTRPLLNELHLHTRALMQDQYGNYVVQFVLERGQPSDRNHVIGLLRGQLLGMASHKFASNVCEKALVHSARADRDALIGEILAPRSDGSTAVGFMIKDQYANYVLQRAMRVSEGDVHERLFADLRFVVPNLRKYSGASPKHLNAIQRILDLDQAGAPLDQHTPPAA